MWFDLRSPDPESTKITKSWFSKSIFYVKNQFNIILIFSSVKIIGLGEHLNNKTIFYNFIFWNSLFSKIGPYSYQLMIKWAQVQSKKYLAGSTFWAKIYIWLAVQLCAPKVRSYYYVWSDPTDLPFNQNMYQNKWVTGNLEKEWSP